MLVATIKERLTLTTLPNKLKPSDCRFEIATKVFKLRPHDYGTKHPIWPGMVGIEVEMMPFVQSKLDQGQANMIHLRGESSLSELLVELSDKNEDWLPRYADDGSLMSIGVGSSEQSEEYTCSRQSPLHACRACWNNRSQFCRIYAIY